MWGLVIGIFKVRERGRRIRAWGFGIWMELNPEHP